MQSIESCAVPRLVYGTAWKRERTEDLVYQAITCGFRSIDTAAQPKHYEEKLAGDAIRRAIKNHIVTREDLYIQTKFTFPRGQDPERMPYDASSSLEQQIRSSISSSLHNLGHSDQEQASYIDCLLLHTPGPNLAITLQAWMILESYVPDKIRTLGISNQYDLDDLQNLYNQTIVKPTILQNRFYKATNYDRDIRDFCVRNNIVYQSFGTLTENIELLRSSPVQTLASSLGVSKPVALYYLVLDLGNVSVLNGTTRAERMRDDLAVLDRMRAWASNNPQLLGEVRDQFAGLLLCEEVGSVAANHG